MWCVFCCHWCSVIWYVTFVSEFKPTKKIELYNFMGFWWWYEAKAVTDVLDIVHYFRLKIPQWNIWSLRNVGFLVFGNGKCPEFQERPWWLKKCWNSLCFIAVYCKKFTQTDRHCVSGWAVVLSVSMECSGFTWRVRRSTKNVYPQRSFKLLVTIYQSKNRRLES